MSLQRFIARSAIAAPFILGGIDTLRNPKPRVEKAADVAPAIASKIGLPTDTELLVKINAGVHVGAGVMLALGKFRRLSALLLLGSIVPTTYAGHRFWEETDAAKAASHRMEVAKNLGLAGGLIHELVDPNPAALRRRVRNVERARAAAENRGAKVAEATKAARSGASKKTADVAGRAANVAEKSGVQRAAKTGAKVVAAKGAGRAVRKAVGTVTG